MGRKLLFSRPCGVQVRMRDTLVTTLDHHLADTRRRLGAYKARALCTFGRRRQFRLKQRVFAEWRRDAHAVQARVGLWSMGGHRNCEAESSSFRAD